jgi:hypothetical protein
MLQQGQVLKLKSKGANGEALWAYRCRLAGRDSKRVQRARSRSCAGCSPRRSRRSVIAGCLSIARTRSRRGG